MILYHGSAINIEKTLKPNRAFDRKDYSPAVYLTDSKELALLYAISPIDAYIKNKFNIDVHCSAISAHLCDIKKTLTLLELYPNMFEDIYHRTAYIYVCDINDSDLEKQSGNIFTTNKEVDFIRKIEIADVYDELLNIKQQGIIKILSFEKIDRWDTYHEYEHIVDCLRSRSEYCKIPEEKSFFEMICKYFPIV